MAITRRKLIQFSSLSLTLLPFISACTSEKNYTEEQNLILGGGRFKLSENGPTQYVFSTVDLRSNITSFIRLNFLPHGIHAHPDTPERLAVFEKKGPHACEIDLKNQELIREITTDSSRYFYGHGTYSADGNLLFCTESNLQSLDGIIAVRDSKSMDYLGEFPSYGKEPHECKLIDNGNILVVTNGGGPVNGSPPSVTYIDIHSEQLLETVNLTNPRINTGHMALAQDGSLSLTGTFTASTMIGNGNFQRGFYGLRA
ncbi:twin-arginine translocation pathway signal [Elysia marginata]|uniref:Twin-arginine translocation pathway signal n=1 Tax=Elysia marginata TaxID=1093978 RepID=A0AAV4GVS5_9GAST|nr:twin-arginine translocation pathway signal [Elysia marginata]